MNNKADAIKWFGPEVGEPELAYVTQVIKSGYINDGDITREFERKIAELIGVKHCLAVTSGTAAITLSLMGLGIGQGDQVIVPDLTFIATANAVKLAGADVKLVDVESNRFAINTDQLEAAITSNTKAIVAVDVNGRGAAYDVLEPFCKKHNLFLVEDAAEALGSRYQNRYLGTFGDAGCFSFSANKTLSTGQGGMIATNNTDLYYRLRELKDQGRRNTGTGGDDLHPVLGFNFKFTNIQAAVGLAQFERMTQRLAQAKKRDQWYQELLKDCNDIVLPPMLDNGEVRQWTDILSAKRDVIQKTLDDQKIGCRPFWFPLHRQIPYQQVDTNYKNAITISQQGLWLPSAFDLTQAQAEKTATFIRQVAQS